MTFEHEPEKIVGLSLVPVRRSPHPLHRGYLGALPGSLHLEHDPMTVLRREEVIDDLHLFLFGVVHAGKAMQGVEGQISLVSKPEADVGDGGGRNHQEWIDDLQLGTLDLSRELFLELLEDVGWAHALVATSTASFCLPSRGSSRSERSRMTSCTSTPRTGTVPGGAGHPGRSQRPVILCPPP